MKMHLMKIQMKIHLQKVQKANEIAYRHVSRAFWTQREFWCERDLIADNSKQAAPIEWMTVTELNNGSQHIST